MESWRMLVVPERSFGGFWHNWYPKDTLRKLYINFHISTCLGIDPSPICLHRVIMESKRTLMVPERSLDGFWQNGCLLYTSMKLHIDFQISTFLECRPTPGFSRASSKCLPWSLGGCWWFLKGVLVVLDIMDVPNIHPGRSVSIFRALAAWEVLQLLGSPERHPSVIHGV